MYWSDEIKERMTGVKREATYDRPNETHSSSRPRRETDPTNAVVNQEELASTNTERASTSQENSSLVNAAAKREENLLPPPEVASSSPQAVASANNVTANNGQNNTDAILERLDRLEVENKRREIENKNLKEEVKRLQDCCPTKLVEFKFTTMKTHLLDDNEWNGVLHIPMIQNPVSGVYTVPNGITNIQGIYSYKQRSDDEIITESFVATVKRDSRQRVEAFYLGINLDYTVGDTVTTRLKPSVSSIPGEGWTTEEFVSTDQRMLGEWEENAGGVLNFYALASFEKNGVEFNPEYHDGNLDNIVGECDYKIKLNTVLSAYKPHQSLIPSVGENVKPDWELLKGVMKSRCPDRNYSDIKKAVQQYVYFLELKKDLSDYKSQLFTPSVEIDKVWHAHLSFLDRYQSDIQALTKVNNKIFEHNPVLGAQARERYKATREAHAERMAAKSKPVDKKFWPESVRIFTNHTLPRRLQREAFVDTFEDRHDGDSDSALYAGEVEAQCG